MNKLIIIGAGRHGKVVADIAEKNGYKDIVFFDDRETVKSCLGYPVIGKTADFTKYRSADFFVAIGNGRTREKFLDMLVHEGVKVVTLVHPMVVIADDVLVGYGTVIMAGTVINSDGSICNGCIISTGSTVDHDNSIEDYAYILVGSHLAGSVHIGKRTWMGIGTVVNNNIDVCDDCVVGDGTVVIRNIECPGTYVGVPTKRIERMKEVDKTILSGKGLYLNLRYNRLSQNLVGPLT